MATNTLERVQISFIETVEFPNYMFYILYSYCPLDDGVTPEFMVVIKYSFSLI